MAGSSKGVTLVAKLLGGKKMQDELKELGTSVKDTGEDAKKSDAEASESTRGWSIFTKQIKTAGEESKKTHDFLKNALSTAVGYASGYLGISGIKDLTNSAGEAAEQTEKFHAATGANIQSSLDWISVAKSRGISEGRIAQSFVLLSKNINSASRQDYMYTVGQEKAAKAGHAYTTLLGIQASAFKELGLNVNQLQQMSPTKQFEAIVTAMGKLTNASEKTRIGMQIFGRGYKELGPLMNNTALGMNAQLKVAREFLPEIGLSGPHAFENLRLAQARSNMAWQGLSLTIGLKLMPVILSLMKGFAQIVKEIERGTGIWGMLGSIVKTVAGVFKTLWEFLTKSKIGIMALTVVVTTLAAAWAVSEVMEFVEALKTLAFVEAITTDATSVLDVAFGALAMVMNAIPILLIITALVLLVTHFKLVEKGLKMIWEWMKVAWGQIEEFFTKPFDAAIKWTENAFNNTIKWFEGIPRTLLKVGKDMWKALIEEPFEAAVKWIEKTFNEVVKWIEGLIPSWAKSILGIGGSGGTIDVGGKKVSSSSPAALHAVKRGSDALFSGIGKGLASSSVVKYNGDMIRLSRGEPVGPLGSTSAMLGNGDLVIHNMIDGREVSRTTMKNFRQLEARR